MARPKLPVRHTEAASPSTRRFIVVPWKKLRWVNSPRAPLMGSLNSRCLYNSLERYRSIYIAMNHAVNWATRNDKNHKPASSERKKALHTPHRHTHTGTQKKRMFFERLQHDKNTCSKWKLLELRLFRVQTGRNVLLRILNPVQVQS